MICAARSSLQTGPLVVSEHPGSTVTVDDVGVARKRVALERLLALEVQLIIVPAPATSNPFALGIGQ